MLERPCEHCPWRASNQGKRTPWGFYNQKNLRRLWNQIRRGGQGQSCHPTDPSHPDHIAAGAKEGATARECPGSVILILREIARMAKDGAITVETVNAYKASRRNGLTNTGILYWLIARYQMGGVPFIGGPKLPEVNADDPAVCLPEYLEDA